MSREPHIFFRYKKDQYSSSINFKDLRRRQRSIDEDVFGIGTVIYTALHSRRIMLVVLSSNLVR